MTPLPPDPAAPVALVCSVPLEAEPLAAMMHDVRTLEVGGKPARAGSVGGVPVLLLAAGMGKTNAAHGVTALLERHRVRALVGFGVGGAYPGSGLEVGAVALAGAEVYGDEGVEAPAGWLSTREIGIPLVERGAARLYNELPVDPELLARAGAALRRAGIAHVAGPFLTLSTCSGTRARGEALAARFGAVCETMEGAAYAHVAALYGVPFLEVRGISNAVEDRDLSRWRLREAAGAAAEAVAAIVKLDS